MSVPWREHHVTIHKPDKSYDGYTLIMPFTSPNAWLIDMRGNYVHRWKLRTPPRNHGILLPNGHLLYAASALLPPRSDMSYPQVGSWGTGGGIVELDWEGNEVWEYVDRYQSHSFDRAKNGNTVICRITKVPEKLARQLTGGIPGTEDRGMIWSDGLHEVTPDGKVVWEWDMAEHLDPDIHVLCPLEFRADFTHMNTVEILANGDILTGFRNIDTVMIIDKAKGKIKWQWGPGEIFHQHFPTQLENGNVLLFDNGEHRKNGSLISYSRAVEVNPVTDKIEWQYRADPPQSFYSALIAGCQRLPNGNTLICEGMRGRVFEVTGEGEIVWQYISPFYAPHYSAGGTSIIGWRYSNSLFRAYRYFPDYPGLKGKELDPTKLAWANRLYGPEAFKN